MVRACRKLSHFLLPFFLLCPPLVVEAEAQNEDEATQLMRSIRWTTGPGIGHLGTLAQIGIPDSMAFADAEGTKKWMQLTHNLHSDDMLGVVVPMSESENWWVLFDYNAVGHIKDDEKDALDADALMKTLRDNNVEGNKERKKRGWETFEIAGWERPPFYDPKTNNMTWAIRIRGTKGESVNYSVRLLGREGYMSADLVLDPDDLATAIPQFERLLAGYSYTQGNRYAEYRAGDKLAAYGLTALVAGGAGAVAAKTGLLAKFWKAIVLAVVAIVASLRRFFGALFKWGKTETIEPPKT